MKAHKDWFSAKAAVPAPTDARDYADRRSGAGYSFDDENKLELAVNVALATDQC